MVLTRVEHAAPDSVPILTVASLIGTEFDLRVLERVLPDHAVLEVIERSEAAGLVTEVEDAAERYRFVHEIVRTTLRAEPSRTRRSRLHRSIGEAIEQLGSAFASPIALAHHFTESAAPGHTAPAVRYARFAVKYLHEQLADDDALAIGYAALAAADRDPQVPAELIAELCLELVTCSYDRGQTAAATALATRAAESATSAGRPDLLRHAAMRACLEAGVARRDGHAIALCEEALATLAPEDEVWRARLKGAIANHLASAGEGAAVRGMASDALELAERHDDPLALAISLTAVLYADWAIGNRRNADARPSGCIAQDGIARAVLDDSARERVVDVADRGRGSRVCRCRARASRGDAADASGAAGPTAGGDRDRVARRALGCSVLGPRRAR